MSWRITFIFFLVSAYAHAQHISRLGRFQVDEISGCAPFTVNITIIPPSVCDAGNACDMFFFEGDVPNGTQFTHVYTEPGSYLLSVQFQNTGMDDIRITVVENIAPQFDLYTCGNNQVSVQLNDSNYDEYIINYNDASPEVVVGGVGTDNHLYTPGAQTVTVRGHNTGADDNCDASGRIVTPLTALPTPTITRLDVLDASRIRLEFDALPNIQYKLGIATNGATNFQQVGTIYNETVDTISNLKTDDNFYCFRLAAFDPCNNTVMNSAVICSANLDLSVRNKAIDVIWSNAATGISNYSLTRTASDGSTLVTAPTGSPYADLGITCGTEYCYQLRAQYTNGSQSFSMTKCGVGFSTETPTAVANITSVVGDNSVVLDWQTDPDFIPAEFTIEKSIGGKYSFLATTTQKAFPDPMYRTEDASCYRIRYKDVCDNESPLSVEACPIRLTATLRKDNSVTLSWTPYGGWKLGVASYIIEKYSEGGVLLQTIPAGTATSYTDASDDLNHQTFVYVVRATATETGPGQSVSNQSPVMKNPNIFHPSAFTPNGDNLNDIFTVFGQYVTGFEMKIFNRWGELLFATTDISAGWDGTYKGNDMPEGTYTFIANITDRAGRTFTRSGSVLLLRKR